MHLEAERNSETPHPLALAYDKAMLLQSDSAKILVRNSFAIVATPSYESGVASD